MEIDDCPLPEVASALGPFIKPRDEVSAIRRNLQAYLQKQISGEDGTPLSAVNLTISPEEDLKEPPPALTGVRKAYWKALQANRAAQAKYDALKADLEALKRPEATLDQPASSITETYIPLLRQKEKLRRLKVLERAYSSLPTLPSDSLEGHLKAHLGAQPTPPSTHAPSSAPQTAPEVEAKVLAVKKAVLTSQRRVQDQETRNAVAKASLPGNEEMGNGAKIAGLQKALQELTGWMEEMLGVIADAEAEAAGESVPPTPGGTVVGRRVELEEIEAAYERYLHSRRRLIQSISEDPESDAEDAEPLFPPPNHNTTSNKRHPSKPSSSELLIPHIERLASVKASETDLLQQKAYIRRQLSVSEAETLRVVGRLAGESHLVQPGASRGADWLKASREAVEETEKVVGERVKAGEQWSRKAREAMEGIEGAGGVMD